MNMWVRRVLLGAALLAVGVWIWTVLFPSPERVIRKRLTELAKSATFGRNESPVAVLLNSQKVAGFFTADVEIKVDVPGRSQQVLSGRDNLFQTTMQLHSALGGLQVDFYDIIVTVAPDKTTAEANLTLKTRAAGERDQIIQELKLWLNKTEGDWRIYRLETIKTLSTLRESERRGPALRAHVTKFLGMRISPHSELCAELGLCAPICPYD